MKCITSFRSRLKETTVVAAIVICLISAVRFSIMAQTPGPSATFSSRALEQPSQLDLLLVFSGYPEIGVPRAGTAIINDSGLSNIHDITFSRVGGELSPDGRLIAYDDCTTSRDHGITVAKPDGSNAKRLTPILDKNCVDIRWSPDGAKLSYNSGPDHLLHIFDLAGKREEVIANTEGADWHWWSPTGEEIVYGQHNGPSGRLLYITDLHGHHRQLTFARDFVSCGADYKNDYGLIDVWAPAWSPRGDKIAFTQCGSLFVISPNGKDLRQLTVRDDSKVSALPITPVYSPRWSPDGRWIIFIGQVLIRPGEEDQPLKRISPDDKVVVDIGTLPYPGGPFSIAPLKR